MRNSLQIYLKQICPAVEWEERDSDIKQGIKAQYASTLLSKVQARKALAVIDAKKETIGLNLEFSIFESRQSAGQYRIVCNLKKESNSTLNKQQLDEVAQFLNNVYGSLTYGSFSKQKIARWEVTEMNDGRYSIKIVGPTSYITPGMTMEHFVDNFNSLMSLENKENKHPCKLSVAKLAITGVNVEMHKAGTIYYWDTKSVNELYELMQKHKKTTFADSNISSKVAAEALSDIPALPPEIRYHVGFFLNQADAGVLAQVKKGSQEALRQAKVACEDEKPHATLSM